MTEVVTSASPQKVSNVGGVNASATITNTNTAITNTTSIPNPPPNPNTTSGATAQRYRYQSEIQAMMYTFGDVKNPVPTTTLLVEDIVHSQIVEMATAVAYRRGVRVLAPEDLLFLIRHDIHRSSRLKEFLSWKDVRKNAKPASSSTTPASSATAAAAAPETNDLAEINEEDARQLADAPNGQQSALLPVNGSGVSNSASANAGKVQIGGPRKRQLCLFWEFESMLTGDLLTPSESAASAAVSQSCQRETLRRLRQADLLTQSMSQQEYMEYSECRQASFTYKKARKFREWLTGGTSRPGTLGLATMAGGSGRELARLSDESLEILGFLAYELVQRVTEVGLAVKCEMDTHSSHILSHSSHESKKPRTGMSGLFENGQGIASIEGTELSTRNPTLPIPNQKSALLPAHIEEAYRRVQVNHSSHSALLKSGLNRKRRLLL